MTDEHRRGSRRREVDLGRFGLPVFLVVIFAVFAAIKPDSYGTVDNIRAVLDNQAVVVILALAAMIPLIVGEFDLSGASVLSLTAVLVVGLQIKEGWSPLAATLAAEAIAVAIGLVNGFIVVKLQVSAFVATLGTSTVLSGIWIWYLNNQVIIGSISSGFTNLARSRVAGIPYAVIYALVITIVLWGVLSLLPIGRRMYATGANRRAAFLSGVNTGRVTMTAFAVSAGLSGIGGIILGARLGSASGGTGTELLLPAFAGAFLGATTIRPGRFNVTGTVIAVYTLAFMIAGLEQLGASTWVTPVFNGTGLVVAVALSGWARQLRARRERRRQLVGLRRRLAQEAEVGVAPRDDTSATAASTPEIHRVG